MSSDNPHWTDEGTEPNDAYRQPHPPRRLETMSPQEAMDIHMARVREEGANWTERSHKSRLSWWLQWCEMQDIDDLTEVTGRDILQYRDWRRQQNGKDPEDVPISAATLKTNLDTLRVYLKHAANANGVHPMLPDQIDPPTLCKDDHARDVHLDAERAETILEHLRKYQYCSLTHIIAELLWHSGCRMGGIRALDVEDCELGENPYLELVHRPDSDTPLKNKSDGERPVAISDGIARLIDDWMDEQRPDGEDEYGREALLTTTHGRVSRNTIRTHIYAVTRPCTVGDCPHDRDPDECKANQRMQWASQCPGSVSPHAVRRGALTHWLDSDWQREHVSERANVSERVLENHYDQRTEIRKMEQRRDNLDRL